MLERGQTCVRESLTLNEIGEEFAYVSLEWIWVCFPFREIGFINDFLKAGKPINKL